MTPSRATGHRTRHRAGIGPEGTGTPTSRDALNSAAGAARVPRAALISPSRTTVRLEPRCASRRGGDLPHRHLDIAVAIGHLPSSSLGSMSPAPPRPQTSPAVSGVFGSSGWLAAAEAFAYEISGGAPHRARHRAPAPGPRPRIRPLDPAPWTPRPAPRAPDPAPRTAPRTPRLGPRASDPAPRTPRLGPRAPDRAPDPAPRTPRPGTRPERGLRSLFREWPVSCALFVGECRLAPRAFAGTFAVHGTFARLCVLLSTYCKRSKIAACPAQTGRAAGSGTNIRAITFPANLIDSPRASRRGRASG